MSETRTSPAHAASLVRQIHVDALWAERARSNLAARLLRGAGVAFLAAFPPLLALIGRIDEPQVIGVMVVGLVMPPLVLGVASAVAGDTPVDVEVITRLCDRRFQRMAVHEVWASIEEFESQDLEEALRRVASRGFPNSTGPPRQAVAEVAGLVLEELLVTGTIVRCAFRPRRLPREPVFRFVDVVGSPYDVTT